MARGKSNRGVRDDTPISSDPLQSPDSFDPLSGLLDDPSAEISRTTSPVAITDPINGLWDARAFSFGSEAPLRRNPIKSEAPPRPGGALVFHEPQFLPVCVKRHQRREVLHALRRTKKGSGSPRRRFNYWSKIKC